MAKKMLAAKKARKENDKQGEADSKKAEAFYNVKHPPPFPFLFPFHFPFPFPPFLFPFGDWLFLGAGWAN